MDAGTIYTGGNGKPIDLAAGDGTRVKSLDTPPLGERGSGISHWDRLFSIVEEGRLFDVPDFNARAVEDMLRIDGVARRIERVITLPLRSARHRLEPAKGDSGEKDLVEELLTRPANSGGMTVALDMVIAQMATARVKRKAFFEKVWKVDEQGRNTYAKLAFRPASSCRVMRDARTGAFQGFEQRLYIDGTEVKEEFLPDKALVHINGQDREPLQGVSDLEAVLTLHEIKKKILWLWMTFCEIEAKGRLVAHGSSVDDTALDALADKAAALAGAGVLALPPGESIDQLQPGTGGDIFKAALGYLDHEAANSVLAGFTELTGESRTGSYALSKDASDFFLMASQAAVDDIGITITQYAIPDLVRFNLGVDAKPPALVFERLAQEESQPALDMLKTIATTTPAAAPFIPREFVSEVVIRVADVLELDRDKVRQALEQGSQGVPQTGAGAIVQAANGAAQLMQQAGLGTPQPTAVPAGA